MSSLEKSRILQAASNQICHASSGFGSGVSHSIIVHRYSVSSCRAHAAHRLRNPLPPLKRAVDDRPPAENPSGAASASSLPAPAASPATVAAAAPSPRPMRQMPLGPAHYRNNNPPRGDKGGEAPNRMNIGGSNDGPRFAGPRSGNGGSGGSAKHPPQQQQQQQQHQHHQNRPMQGGGGGNRSMPSTVVSTKHSGSTEPQSAPQYHQSQHQPSTMVSSGHPSPLISSGQTPAKPTPKIERAAADWLVLKRISKRRKWE